MFCERRRTRWRPREVQRSVDDGLKDLGPFFVRCKSFLRVELTKERCLQWPLFGASALDDLNADEDLSAELEVLVGLDVGPAAMMFGEEDRLLVDVSVDVQRHPRLSLLDRQVHRAVVHVIAELVEVPHADADPG